jgi:hypothetical protein
MKHELTDTSAEATALHRRLLSARSGEQRLRMASDMFEAARRLVLASLPDDVAADPVERRVALFRRFYGRDLAPEVVERIVARIRSTEAPAPSGRSGDETIRR